MNTKELDYLFTFKMGLPSLYHIMLGMSEDETEDYEKELGKYQTDNYDLNDFLKKYDIVVERTAFTGEWRLKEMTVSIPLEHIKERELKMLFEYLIYRMNVIEKKFTFTSNANDEICEFDILIRSDLYDVTITKSEENDNEYVVITFFSENDIILDKLRCLAIIVNNEKQFIKDIMEYVNLNRE